MACKNIIIVLVFICIDAMIFRNNLICDAINKYDKYILDRELKNDKKSQPEYHRHVYSKL